jgi:hypothetical protein
MTWWRGEWKETGRVKSPVGMYRTLDRVLHRAARIAYTFVMMNYAAVAGLLAAARGRDVWK